MNKADRVAYLLGLTPKCSQCDKRVVTKADTICAMCKTTAEKDKYEEDLKAARNFGTSWYIVATLDGVRYFVCIGCRKQYEVAKSILEGESEEPPKPIIPGCVQTYTCKSAAFCWGSENREPERFLRVYQEEMVPRRFDTAIKKTPSAQGDPLYDALHDAAERYKDNPSQAVIDAAPIMAITKRAIADVAAGH